MRLTSMKNKHIGSTWDDLKNELVEKGALSEEEIRESNLRVALMGELVKARNEKHLSQRDLENMSGVRQPVIARMESGVSAPRIDTVMKVLAPLGKTLAIVPIKPQVE
jgi:ribosome-binding protein aMBF1 (putative translation factor)